MPKSLAQSLTLLLAVLSGALVVHQLIKRVGGGGSRVEEEDDRDTRKKKRLNMLEFENASYSNLGELEAKDINKKTTAWQQLGLEQPLVIAMVGLPARGKSFISKMIIRYLKWTGFECEVFNVGSHRRHVGLQSADASFFGNGNEGLREEMAMSVQDDMYVWLHGVKRRVAIFDATNTTKKRRLALAKRARAENSYLLFVESICDDQQVLRRNYQLKLENDDYKGMDPAKAYADFSARVEQYEKRYETIEDSEDDGQISYIQLINVGQKVITRNCSGYLPSQISFYLQNVHIGERKIYLCLNAESVYCASPTDTDGTSIGEAGVVEGDRLAGTFEAGELSEAGRVFGMDLAKFLQERQEGVPSRSQGKEMLVLTGTSREQAESISHLRILYTVYCTQLLNELRGGDLHGLSKAQIKERYPIEYEKRNRDKLNYRYPGSGESYLDVIERIRPIIIELERQRKSVLIVCHMAVLRCISSYFLNTDLADIPFQKFKRHHVYELNVGAFGTTMKEFPLPEFFL